MTGKNKKPTIHTLVEDIEKVFSPQSKAVPTDEDLKTFSKNVSEAIVSTFIRNREKGGHDYSLRMSNIGKPSRQLWYETRQDPETTEPLSYSLLLKFLYGSILEELMVLLCRTAGHVVTEQQKEYKLEGVVGHQDARVDDIIVDFKSASGRSFKKFKDHSLLEDDPFGYIAQLSSYAQAAGEKEAAFIAIDKQSGEITLMPLHQMEMINAKDRITYLKGAIQQATPPEKCYLPVEEGKSGNYKLSIGCVYCKFKKECWSEANNGKGLRTFQYANGIRFFTDVKKQPRVDEVFI